MTNILACHRCTLPDCEVCDSDPAFCDHAMVRPEQKCHCCNQEKEVFELEVAPGYRITVCADCLPVIKKATEKVLKHIALLSRTVLRGAANGSIAD